MYSRLAKNYALVNTFDFLAILMHFGSVMAKPDKSAGQVRVYLSGDDFETLKQLKDRLEDQSEAWILSTITSSALRGIKANGLTFPLPLKLAVQPEIEPKTGKK